VEHCFVENERGLPSDTHGNTLSQHNTENKAKFIYVPKTATKDKGKLRLFNWTDPYFHEVIGVVHGCGDRREIHCDHGFRMCAHCERFNGECRAKKVGDMSNRHDSMGKHYGLEERPITRAGELIL
jgi:hypothetical protein